MAKPPRPYYILVEFDGTQRCMEFGDYDRAVVEFERFDHQDKGVKAKCLRVLVAPETQQGIDAFMAALNTKS